MHPVCFRLGPVTVHWYGVMMALGFLAGLVNWMFVGRREGRDFKFCSDLLFWIMVAGIVGARVVYVLTDLAYFVEHPAKLLRIDEGGLTYYGGFIGAWLALYGFARSRKIAFFDLADFVVTSLPLAHAFGRVGCLMNGCCHGAMTGAAAAVRYPADSMAWHEQLANGAISPFSTQSLAVHPVQLYEAAFNLAVFALLAVLYRRRRRNGVVAVAYLMVYAVGRFLLEFLRGDYRIVWRGVSLAQWVSLGLFLCGAVLYRVLRRQSDHE